MLFCMDGLWLSLSVPQTVSRVKTEGRTSSGAPSAPVHNPIQTPDFGMIVDDEISVVPEWQVCDAVSNPAHVVLSVINLGISSLPTQNYNLVPEGRHKERYRRLKC